MDYCKHPDAPRGYGNVLNRGSGQPRWCPLGITKKLTD
jgi:hypothetical protein